MLNLTKNQHNSILYFSGVKGKKLLNQAEDIVDVLGEMYELKRSLLLLYEENLPLLFFDLKSKVCGELLRKLSTYRVKTVFVIKKSKIVGRFKEFVRETNKGREFRFTDSFEEARDWLAENP